MKRVQELEAKGWQCVHPIRSKINPFTVNNHEMNRNSYKNTYSNSENMTYYVTMEREGSGSGANGWQSQQFYVNN